MAIKTKTSVSLIKKNIKPLILPNKKKIITGEELFAMGDIGPTELVKGEIVYLMPTGFLHGVIEVRLANLLSMYVNEYKLGVVFGGETGVYTSRDPDTVRGVDAGYISYKRLAEKKSNSFLDVAPELIVEIKSPDDSWTTINTKIEEYFNIGTLLIWIVDPKKEEIYVYTSINTFQILSRADTLTGGDVLPSFSTVVAEIFG